MNRWKVVGLTLGLVVIVALPVTRDEIRWQFSQLLDSAADYQRYLDAWPTGRHSSQARARLDEQNWILAGKLGTRDAFTAYLREQRDGAYIPQAKAQLDLMDDRAWSEATKQDTVTGYAKYISIYGTSGRHSAAAREHWIAREGQGGVAIGVVRVGGKVERNIRVVLHRVYFTKHGEPRPGPEWYRWDGRYQCWANSVTDENGRWQISGLEEGDYFVSNNCTFLCGLGMEMQRDHLFRVVRGEVTAAGDADWSAKDIVKGVIGKELMKSAKGGYCYDLSRP